LESFIFLGLILLVGAITQNKSIVYATIFVLILKVLFNITESYKLKGIDIQNFMTQFRKEGINWGVLVITVAILIPIATGEIGFSHLLYGSPESSLIKNLIISFYLMNRVLIFTLQHKQIYFTLLMI